MGINSTPRPEAILLVQPSRKCQDSTDSWWRQVVQSPLSLSRAHLYQQPQTPERYHRMAFAMACQRDIVSLRGPGWPQQVLLKDLASVEVR